MRRLFLALTAVAVLLAVLVPTALAAGPEPGSRSLLLATNRTVDIPPGDHVDTLVVIDGDARIAGDVGTIVIAGGTATLDAATARTLVVVNGTATLGAGTTITGDVRTLDGTVTQQSGAVVQGSVRSLDADLATFAFVMIPFAFLLLLGLGLAAIVAALLVAGLAARQTRELESLISREPGQVLVAGIAGTVALPALAILLMITVVGAPLGLGLLVLVLPAVAFAAWIVAAIWIGDWLVGRMRGAPEPERPYLAAVLGTVTLAIAGLLPFVTALATLFGFGALILAAWRTIRRRPERGAIDPMRDGLQPAPSAS